MQTFNTLPNNKFLKRIKLKAVTVADNKIKVGKNNDDFWLR